MNIDFLSPAQAAASFPLHMHLLRIGIVAEDCLRVFHSGADVLVQSMAAQTSAHGRKDWLDAAVPEVEIFKELS